MLEAGGYGHVVHADREPLPDDAVVVRGGKLSSDVLANNAESVYLESGLRGICAGAAEMPSSAGAVAAAMPYRGMWFCEAKLGDLRAEGFDVVMVDDPPHCVILLDSETLGAEWDGWDRLRRVFTDPRRIRRE